MLRTLALQIKGFKKDAILTPICMILEVLFETMIPFLMASIIDKGVEAGDIGHIYRIGGCMVALAACGLLAGVLGGRFAARASAGYARNLREAMFVDIQSFSFSNIDKYSTAGLVTRLTTDVTNIQNAFQMLLRMCFRAPFSMICAMTMAFAINARLASIYLGAVVFLGILLFMIVTSAMEYFQQAFPKYDDMNASVQENVSAIRVVKAYVREDHETEKFRQASRNIYDIFKRAEYKVIWNAPLMQITVYGCIMLISWLGARMIVSDALTTGELMSLLTYCMNILMSLMMLSMVFVMLTMSVASARRIVEVLEEKSDLAEPEDPIFTVEDGSIRFEGVDFAYHKESEEPVLHQIDLKIHPGETIGVIGGTGSAKTSLVNLISRLYDVTAGRVLVGGVDVRQWPAGALRARVGVVPQKAVLFQGTIRENLLWGKDNGEDPELWAALEAAQARDFVERKPKSLDEPVEQGGRNFSGGQRQRLTIARALVRRPEILILDDSASALDLATDARLRQAIRGLDYRPTVFIVSQRASSIRHADQIIVLEDGAAVGIGTHEELLESCQVYREIYQSQFEKGGAEHGAKG